MLNRSKISIALAFVLTLIVSSVSFSPTTEAGGSIKIYADKFQEYFECILNDKGKNGSIRIRIDAASNKIKNYTIRMEDKNGRYIWEQTGISANRSYELGNDHDVYIIKIKANGKNGARGQLATAWCISSPNLTVNTK